MLWHPFLISKMQKTVLFIMDEVLCTAPKVCCHHVKNLEPEQKRLHVMQMRVEFSVCTFCCNMVWFWGLLMLHLPAFSQHRNRPLQSSWTSGTWAAEQARFSSPHSSAETLFFPWQETENDWRASHDYTASMRRVIKLGFLDISPYWLSVDSTGTDHWGSCCQPDNHRLPSEVADWLKPLSLIGQLADWPHS